MNEELKSKIKFGVVGCSYEPSSLVKYNLANGEKIIHINGLNNKEFANAYWSLDKNAFGTPAPKYMKLDTIIMGGVGIAMMLPKKYADSSLVKELNAENLKDVPIGFMDMHHNGNNNYSCSGLGIAKQYQGKGLSDLLINSGLKITKTKSLLVPTQLSNIAAHKAWIKALGPLMIYKVNPLHDEDDTVVYLGGKTHSPHKKPFELTINEFLEEGDELKYKAVMNIDKDKIYLCEPAPWNIMEKIPSY